MVTLSFTIFSGQKNYNRAHMLFQVLCGFEPIFYTTHPNEESIFLIINATSLLSQLKTHKLCIMSKSIKISVRNCIIAHALKIIPQFNYII